MRERERERERERGEGVLKTVAGKLKKNCRVTLEQLSGVCMLKLLLLLIIVKLWALACLSWDI